MSNNYGLQTAINSPADIIAVGSMNKIQELMRSGASKEEIQKATMEAMEKMTSAGGNTCFSPEFACGAESKKEHRAPVIEQIKAAVVTPIDTASSAPGPGFGIVANVLATLFPDDASRKFFWPNDPNDTTQRAKTYGRALVGVGASWDVTVTRSYTAATGATPTTKTWTEEELAGIKAALSRCRLAVFDTSSDEPRVNDVQLNWYGESGKLFPRSLQRQLAFVDENAHVRVANPAAYADTLLIASTGTYNIAAALTLTGLFVDPRLVPGYFAGKK